MKQTAKEFPISLESPPITSSTPLTITSDAKPKKPKVETRDAVTQTDRSDYAIIKAKRELKRREHEEMILKLPPDPMIYNFSVSKA